MRLVYIVIGWCAGILLAANNPNSAPLLWLGLGLFTCLMAWLSRGDKLQMWGFVALAALMFGGARMAMVSRSSDVAQYNNSGGLTIEGVVSEAPDIRDERVQLRVAVESVTRGGETLSSSGLVLVYAPPTAAEIRYGDRIAATGLLITPAEYDTFSYADFLGRSGVFSIMDSAAVEVLASGEGNPIYGTLLELRRNALNVINAALPEPQAGLLAGILLGEERGISPALIDAFSAVGASHVVAISGFNMAVLSGTLMGLFERFKTPKRIAVFFGVAIIVLYTIFVGANAAVVRAAVMSSLLVIAPLLKRNTYVPASLAFVALLMSVLNPTVLWDISFQLSFFATLGLTLFATPLSKRFNVLLSRLFPSRIADALGNFLAEPIVVSIAASITTIPLITLYFSRLSLVMLPVNLLVVPVQSILLMLGLVATLIALAVPIVGQMLFWLVLPLLSWTIAVVRLFARLPFADVEFHVDSRLIAVYFFALIGWALMQATQPLWLRNLSHALRRRAVLTAALFAGALVLLLIGAVFFSRPDGNLHVWLLDLGHNNAVLIQTPRGAHILVDGGRFPSRLLTAIGDRLPFTDREIEILFITQPDEFDTSALPAVLGRYQIGAAVTNGQPSQTATFASIQQALANTPVVSAQAGYTVTFDDGVLIEVLHPQQQPELGASLDDGALVLRVTYGDVSFLLTGDLSQSAQNALLSAGEYPLATVMQLPQHATTRSLSSDFLDTVQPSLVVLQSDSANRRGDPNADVLALLPEVPLLRTDLNGDIHLWTDGENLWALPQRR
jgi:competence protein ComEC